ncbi:MAG: hypothetical protein DRN53_03530 [Thermoprotei archaeon]|nr:MAG: hypothetical protein DRN53_03530 [Thermoprotei archaeon]
MVVRVKVRLRALKGSIGEVVESVAVLNSGYESVEEEVIIPVRVAERLGLWPRLPEGTEVEEYEVAGGIRVRTYFIRDCLEVQVITEDSISKPVKTVAVIMEGQDEILLSDASISAHRIVIEDAKEGLWRFRGEEKLRKSEKPQYW